MLKISGAIIALVGFVPAVFAADATSTAFETIDKNRNDWFTKLDQKIISPSPYETDKSFASENDLKISNKLRAYETSDNKAEQARFAQAKADEDLKADYMVKTFGEVALGQYSESTSRLNNEAMGNIFGMVLEANQYSVDGKSKFTTSPLKDKYARIRPYDIVDENGNYKLNVNPDDYDHKTSYPSGHTWAAFEEGISYALAFPEIGDEALSRSLISGESRVIVSAHFPTDTIASRTGNYYALSELLSDDTIVEGIVENAKEARANLEKNCGDSARNCLAQNDKPNYNAQKADNFSIGYYGVVRDDQKAVQLKASDLPKQAQALLRLRFPYLTEAQRLDILASTAYPSNSLAAFDGSRTDEDRNWGLINLPSAYNGPAYLYKDLVVNQSLSGKDGKFDFAEFGAYDEWNNHITGDHKLIKEGDGTLVLNGDLTIQALDIKQGTLAANGNSSKVKVNVGDKATLSGKGTVGDITFNAGSTYSVNVDASQKDKNQGLTSTGQVNIAEGDNGAKAKITLEKAPLAVQLGDYKILHADGGINGQFDLAENDLIFIGSSLAQDSSSKDIVLSVTQKNSFESVAITPNNASVAIALQSLADDNAFKNSILASTNADQANNLFSQATGQVHSDINAVQLRTSRLLQDTMTERMLMAGNPDMPSSMQVGSGGNVWVKAIGSWNDIDDQGSLKGYDSDTAGLLIGADSMVVPGTLIGATVGYSKTNLDSLLGSSADSKNTHVGLYASQQLGDISLRAGGTYSWDKTETKRHVNYANTSEQFEAKYTNEISQAFIEGAYTITINESKFEPFVNFSYVHNSNDKFEEHGGEIALEGTDDSQSAKYSTVGIRGFANVYKDGYSSVNLTGELGWLHQFDDLEEGKRLMFVDGVDAFTVHSVTPSEDAAVVKVGVNFAASESTNLSLGYNGILSSDNTDNSVNAGVSWKF